MGTHMHWRDDAMRGESWFKALPPNEKNEVGDALVLGYFDWRDYAEAAGWERKPSAAFLRGADQARVRWEIMSTGGVP